MEVLGNWNMTWCPANRNVVWQAPFRKKSACETGGIAQGGGLGLTELGVDVDPAGL